MSVDFIARLIGMVGLFIGGFYTGTILGKSAGDQPVLWAIIFGLVGALMGLVVTPFLTTRPIRAIRTRITQVSVRTMIAGLIAKCCKNQKPCCDRSIDSQRGHDIDVVHAQHHEQNPNLTPKGD